MSSRKRKKNKAAPAAKGGKKPARPAPRTPAKPAGRNQAAATRSGRSAKAAAAVAEDASEVQELQDTELEAVAETEPATGEHPAPELADDEEAAPVVSEITELRPRGEESESDAHDVGDTAVEAIGEATREEGEGEGDVEVEAPPPEAPTTRAHLKRLIESLIFVSDQIITPQQIARIVKSKQAEVRELVKELSAEYEGRGIELVEIAGGYQFRSAAASAPFVRDLVAQRPVRLTRAQLETLALIAYRQPITRPEIDDVRGVDSGSAIKVLLERDLVKILGRKDEAGRPLLYGTAPYFLEFFSMKGMQDLPTLREFTELNEEHRELFQRKTGEIPDLSAEALTSLTEHSEEDYTEEDGEAASSEPAENEVAAAAPDENSEAADDGAIDDTSAVAASDFDEEAPTVEHPALTYADAEESSRELSDTAQASDDAEA